MLEVEEQISQKSNSLFRCHLPYLRLLPSSPASSRKLLRSGILQPKHHATQRRSLPPPDYFPLPHWQLPWLSPCSAALDSPLVNANQCQKFAPQLPGWRQEKGDGSSIASLFPHQPSAHIPFPLQSPLSAHLTSINSSVRSLLRTECSNGGQRRSGSVAVETSELSSGRPFNNREPW